MERPDSQRLRPEDRLRRRSEYLACYHRGRAVTGPVATLHVLANPYGRPRLGVTATRKLGNAVVRNRLRRRCREVYRRWERRGELPPLDIVVNLRPRAAGTDFRETRRLLQRQLETLVPRRRE
ncbi:MAG TPA: ribonuclease P protein component [Thermoanaerobaculia bacterium]|nr:ribonuclease P protein component [Thermoanaerobaculia bacterium]